jgi:hypothetical protein
VQTIEGLDQTTSYKKTSTLCHPENDHRHLSPLKLCEEPKNERKELNKSFDDIDDKKQHFQRLVGFFHSKSDRLGFYHS